MTEPEKIETLRAALPGMDSRDSGFADSLVRQYDRRGNLSSKQWYWVNKLIEPPTPVQPLATIEVQNCGRIFEMFRVAQTHLKHPKIRFMQDNEEIALMIAGPNSKYHGKVLITDGKPFGMNKFYGSIDRDGVWEQSRRNPPSDKVIDLILRLAEDPEKAASEYGLLTGNCCFCGIPLSDERSTGVGYGPKCAKNYGLTWGKKAPKVGVRQLMV